MRFVSFVQGSDEPVSVSEARESCRVDEGVLDLDISTSITAAREQAEHATGRIYRAQVLRHEATTWPDGAFSLAVWPATSLVITYRAAATPDAWTTLATSVYSWGEQFPRIAIGLKTGQSWPELADDDSGASIRIDVTAGPASPATVPGCVRRYILSTAASWLANPEGLMPANMTVNPLFARLLDGERTWA